TLRDLLDVSLLREFSEHVQRMFFLGLLIFSRDKNILVNTCERFETLQKELKSTRQKDIWSDFLNELSAEKPGRDDIIQKRFSPGFDFCLIPIMNETDVIGYVALGPFLTTEEKAKSKKAKQAQAASEIPRFSQAKIKSIARFVS